MQKFQFFIGLKPSYEFLAEYCFIKFDWNKSGVMKCKAQHVVQNLDFKTFYYQNDLRGKTILFLFLKNNIDWMNTLLYLMNFWLKTKEGCNRGVACSLLNLGWVHCKSPNLLRYYSLSAIAE